MKRSVWMLVLFLAAVLLTGCNLFDTVQTVPAGGILFSDDFSNPKTGWNTWAKDENGSMVAYQNEALRIIVNAAQYDFWSRPGEDYGDVHVEVDAAKVGGPNDNDYGIICRYMDRDNFYGLLISSDGYYGVLKVKDGIYGLIGSEACNTVRRFAKGMPSISWGPTASVMG